ncbi:alpha/beta hydrolase [Bradyrhizobium sp. NAS80.1]|uniref:alpha/beta fold hydrolase n=1 Tax=Bradyrhizobium sp. NAS80.1 TaxID=1680159 RepID=UPI000A032CC5|nr:alpha/beta hydrolase [Bradyrhizobium sp. NAS80.1]
MDTIKILANDGTTLFAQVLGSGRPFVIVHGSRSDSRDWLQVARLLAADYRVHVIDRRGYGQSGTRRTDYAIMHDIDDLMCILRHIGGGALLFGHSFGGRRLAVDFGQSRRGLS